MCIRDRISDGQQFYKITPSVSYFNLDTIQSAKLYTRITNLSGATADVSLAVYALVLEG